MSGDRGHQEKRYEGVSASPGIARGPLHVFTIETDDVVRYQIDPAHVPDEIARFESALIQTRAQILEMQQQIAEAIGAKDAGIFDAHLLVVEDQTLIDEVLRRLEIEHCNVEFAFHEVANRYVESLTKIDDPYLRERALDIQDVARRVIRNLQGKSPRAFLAAEYATHPGGAQSHPFRHRDDEPRTGARPGPRSRQPHFPHRDHGAFVRHSRRRRFARRDGDYLRAARPR